MNLCLASQSPRRREMLAWLGLPFITAAAYVDESPQAGESPDALVVRLAQRKALAITATPDSGVLAADTIVTIDQQLLGKPRDAEEARAMLSALRGKEHTVLTALSLSYQGQLSTRVVSVRVWMRNYSADEIEAYIASGDPFDKAGAYAIQHPVFRPVSRVDVCYAAVVGFPLCALRALLEKVGVAFAPVAMPDVCFRHLGYSCPHVDVGREA